MVYVYDVFYFYGAFAFELFWNLEHQYNYEL